MKYLKLYEDYNKSLELKNDLQNHLSQYPFIGYSLNDDDKNVIITFNKDISLSYGTGILKSFEYDILSKKGELLKLRIKDIKTPEEKEDDYKNKTVIETVVKIDIPTFNLKGILAKPDSGAVSSSILVSKIRVDRKTKKVSFVVLDDTYEQYTGVMITRPLSSEINVQSSNGKSELRP
jgi:hypothetical protein